MSIKPILFNTEMVRSILDGRKTQTRRVVKEFTGEVILSVRSPDGTEIGKYGRDGWRGKLPDRYDGNTYCVEAKPPCKAGDILWVRETWSTHYDGIHDDLQFCYKADGIDLQAECMPGESNRWYPSIHMPKEAARIFLRVTDVRVERLQDITEDDVCDEGAEPIIRCNRQHPVYDRNGVSGDMCWNTNSACKDCPEFKSYAELFGEDVWNETIKKSDMDKYGWSANPWVWVIKFERCDKPEGDTK